MSIFNTEQLASLLHVRPQTLRRDRCRSQPQIPYLKTPNGRIFYEKDVVNVWLAHRLNGGLAK